MNLLGLDLETTGLDASCDRVIEIALIMRDETGKELERYNELVFPADHPIPPEISELTGITPDMVEGKPLFSELVPRVLELLDMADAIVAYNANFDIRFLKAELMRADVVYDFSQKRILDPQGIFFHHEPRNLAAATRYYCNKELEGAHRAAADVDAALDILSAQIARYGLDLNEPEVRKYAEITPPLDSNGAFSFNDLDKIIFNFGKHRHQEADPRKSEIRNYLSWMSNANFPQDTKNLAKALCTGKRLNPANIGAALRGEPL